MLQVVTGQDYGYFKGVVKEKATGETLVGAHVILKKDRSFGAATDLNGRFSLMLKPGDYFFLVSFTSMKTDTVSVHIAANRTTERIIELLPFSTVFDEIEIKGWKFNEHIEELTYSVEVIKPKLIENKNTRNITTILDQMPGLNILDSEPQIRGGSGFTFGVGSKVAVMLDGIPILSGDAGRPEWNFIPTENIERVEIVKGASSVLSGGSALSGAIYIWTAYPTAKPLTKFNVYVGGYSTPKNKQAKWWTDFPYITGANFLHSRMYGNLDLVLGGDINFDHGYLGPAKPLKWFKDTVTDFTKSQMATQRARFNFNLRYRTKKFKGLNYGLSGNFMYNNSSMVFAWFDDTTGFYRLYPGAALLQNQFVFYVDPYLNYYSSIGIRHSLKARIMCNNNHMSNDQSNRFHLIYGDYQFRKNYININDLELTMGLTTQYTNSYSKMYMGSGSPKNKLLNVSGYLQLEKKVWNVLTVVLGVRAEYFKLNDSIKDFQPIFRAGANIKLMQETYLRASFGQGYRFPTITERFIRTSMGTFGVFNNPDLKPEFSWNAEIGIKQGFKFGNYYGYLDIAFFWQEYSNTIEYLFGFWDSTFTFAVAGFKFVNTGKSKISGVDISITGQAKIKEHLRMNTILGYNYIMPISLEPYLVFTHDYNPGGATDFSYYTTSIDPSRDILKYRFLHSVKADIEFEYKNFSIGYSLKYFSRIENLDKAIKDFEIVTTNSGTMPPIMYMRYFDDHNNGNFIMDARINYEFLDKHKIALISNNFLNRTYSLRPLKAEPMRTFMIQYTLKL